MHSQLILFFQSSYGELSLLVPSTLLVGLGVTFGSDSPALLLQNGKGILNSEIVTLQDIYNNQILSTPKYPYLVKLKKDL